MNRFWLACKAFVETFKAPLTKEIASTPTDLPHLRLLTLLQKEGRLIDFLKEDISKFSDAQVGAAVRKIHSDCSHCMEEFVTIRPLYQENEGSVVTVAQGYDPAVVKVIGHVVGQPPYRGILRHKGWKAHKLSLPKVVQAQDPAVICPAEVEVKP